MRRRATSWRTSRRWPPSHTPSPPSRILSCSALEESRLRAAHDASTEWLAGLEGDDSARIVAAAGAPGHPTLAAHLVTVFYGEGAEGCDERVRAGFLLMLRTLTDALDLGPIEA